RPRAGPARRADLAVDGRTRRTRARVLDPAGRLGRGALLALVLPVGRLAEAGGLDDLEAEHRALHPGRGDVDPEQLEDLLLRHPQDLLAGPAEGRVGEQGGCGGRYRASLTLEGDLGHSVVVVELQIDVLLVTAERIR